MTPPLSDDDARRIYIDALDRAVRHAAVHVPRDEAREVGHHVATSVVRRHQADSEAESSGGSATRRRPIDSIDAFVHRAVVNRLREIWRARRRRRQAERLYEDERTSVAPAWVRPDSDLASRELHETIEAAIAALPDTRREVFLLIRRDQRSYREVAAQLGIAVGTVHTHLSRANASLRRAVAEAQQTDQPRTIGRLRILGGQP
jgi:RNA polymerase sigma factor (sigma-70 family)